MTGTFIRLKLAVIRNGLRQSTGRTIGWVTGTLFTLFYALATAAGMIALRGDDYAPSVAVTLAVALGIGWAVMPLFLFGGDDTLDPTRLAMLPLRPRPLIGALLVSSLFGVGPVFTVLATAGAVAALAHGAASVVAGVVAVPLVLLLCVALSRAVAAANTRLLTSRRGRDLALLSGLFVAVGAQLVNLGASTLASSDGLHRVRSVASVLRWVPPAPAVDAVRAAADGSYGLAVAELACVAAVLALVLFWWHRSLYRLMVSPDASTLRTSEAKARKARSTGLSRFLPAGRTGTVMERQFRYAWRDPRAKAAWATALAVGLLLPVVSAVQHGSVYSSCWAAGLLGLQMYNQFGADGSAFWTVAATISTRRDAYAELSARALSIAVVAIPYVAAVTIGAALLLDRAGAIPETLGLSFALLGALIATGTFASVRFPYAVPHDNPFGNAAPGQGGLATLSVFAGGAMGSALCIPPLAVLIWLHIAGHHGWLWLLLPGGALYGAALAVGGLRFTAPRMVGRLPEILAAVSSG
ncbi:MAG: type transport system permease protein [Streptomycetaceae bacterium]|nr:type transport system permease protein [Streptomycetaceae bacterium]